MKRRIRAIVKKEFIHIIRDWRSLAVAVMLPIVLLLLYGYGINLDVKHLRTAVLDMDNTQDSRKLLDSFEQSGYFSFVERMSSYSELTDILDYSKAGVAIIVPKGFAKDVDRGKAEVQIVVDGSDATTASLAISYSSRITQEYSRDLGEMQLAARGMAGVAIPSIDVRTRYWYNPELESSDFIVPGLIAIILMLLSSLLTSMTIVRERERGTIEQVVVSPIKPHELVIGKLIPYVILAFFDIILVTLGATLIFHVPLRGSVLLLMATSILFLVAALGLGLLISSISNTQLVAMTIAVLATMLPSVLLSGFIYPIRTMPTVIQALTYLLPARHYLVIVRGIFLKGVGPSILWPQALILLIMGVVLIGLSAKKFRKVI